MRHEGWNSLICAHVKDASAQIRGMYSRLLREYPKGLKVGKEKDWMFVPYEKSASVSWVPAREAQVAIATSLSPNTLRGGNFAMAHLSEVAFWADGDEEAASEIVRTVCGSIALEPETLIVMESTANGTDNYFYEEWKRAVAGKSDKRAVFVPWHEIEIYRMAIADEERKSVEASLDDYERQLLADGVELERVAWYHEKRREYASHEAMMAEFPSTPEEAFANAGGTALLTNVAEVTAADEYDSESHEGDSLGVLLISDDGRRQALSFFKRTSEGLLPVGDEELDGMTLGRAVAHAARECSERRAQLLIAEAPRLAATTHIEWCVREAFRLGARLAYDDNESAGIKLEGTTLLHCGDVYSSLAERGKMREFSEKARRELLRCQRGKPWQTPLAMTRIAAAHHFGCMESTRVSLADFIS